MKIWSAVPDDFKGRTKPNPLGLRRKVPTTRVPELISAFLMALVLVISRVPALISFLTASRNPG